MGKILVVGGTGKVGGAVMEELTRAGEKVRAATRSPWARTAWGDVEPMQFDLADPETFGPALEGADRVFLLDPGAAGDTGPAEFTLPFLQTAARGGCKVVLMTTLSVEFDDAEPMRKVEEALTTAGTPFVILRPNWFMDNFHTLWLPAIREAGLLPLPAGDARCSFIDSRDVGASGAAALRTDRFNGRAFALTGPESLTHSEAAAILSKAAEREIRYLPVDDDPFIRSLMDAGIDSATAEYIASLFRFTRDGRAAAVSPAVQELTGQPARTLAQYARDHASAWR